MDIKKVVTLIESLEKTGWNEFKMEEGDFSLTLKRNAAKKYHLGEHIMEEEVEAFEPVAEHQQVENTPVMEQGKDSGPKGKDITSPLVGIVRELPGDKKVVAGTQLKEGDVLCNIEAMKLMNEVTMPEDGTITYVAVAEGDSVEFGQVLFQYV